MEVSIGSVIKDLRNRMGITQQQLASGICTQAQISKLENGKEIPSSYLLYLLSRKLNVSMEYFFDTVIIKRHDYIKTVIQLIRKQIRERNYKEVMEIILNEEDNPYFLNDNIGKQFLMWHKGICYYYLNRDHNTSLKLLFEAFHITAKLDDNLNEREIEIINSIAIIYNEIDLFEDSLKYYLFALNNIKKIPELEEPKIYIRVLYGISKTYRSLKEYQKSIDHINLSIKLCRETETFYLYGELEYLKGKNYLLLGKTALAKRHFQNAIMTFRLEGRNEFIIHVEKELNKLS